MPRDDVNGGHNMTKLKKDIVDGKKRIDVAKLEREAANEEIAAVRADLEAKGIKKEALDMALRYANWDEDKREGFDIAYELVREAIELPFDAQGDLFKPKEDNQPEE